MTTKQTKEKKVKESDVQRMICDYLALRSYFFWRSNNISVYDPTRQTFRAMPKYSMRGVPDIIVIKEGKFIGLEVKAKSGTLSEGQERFKELCMKHNAEYHTVKNIEDVQAIGL